jgi:hypothetical protein
MPSGDERPHWTVNRKVGRLVEGRVFELVTAEDARLYCDQFRRILTVMPTKSIICADYRSTEIFSPVAADELTRLMIEMKPLILRSAVIASKAHATNTLQVDRVLREAAHPARRRFHDAGELLAWLGEVLEPDERARAAEFLMGPA